MSTEDPNSLQSHQYANVIDLICEGPIQGLVGGLQGVYLNNTPVIDQSGNNNFTGTLADGSTYTGVSVSMTAGGATQSVLYNGPASGAVTNVNSKLFYGTPQTQHIVGTGVTRLVVVLNIPSLNETDTSNGDIHGSSVRVQISLSSGGGAYSLVYDDTITGKCMSEYDKQYILNTPPWVTYWDVKIQRITVDSSSAYVHNDLYWKSITSVVDAPLYYPYSVLSSISIDSQYFQSVPTRGYHIQGLLIKIPSNYNPVTRVYTGTWDGTFTTAYSNNPAWCFYDLVTNTRYGLGNYISASQVDKWSLYTIAQYCDAGIVYASDGVTWIRGGVPTGFGGYEPRFTCNLYLQTAAEAYKVLANMASVFRGMAYWIGGQVTVSQDSPATPSAIFTPANVVNGSFSYSSTALKARHTVALVTWNDPALAYQQKVEYVEDAVGIAKYGVQQVQVTAFGCTSRGQAHRFGLWTLYTERMETETITFKTGMEHTLLTPGMVISTNDPTRAGVRFGGRIVSSTTSSITPDGTINFLAGKTYNLSVMLPTGAVETHAITNAGGTSANPTTPITISGTFTSIPASMAMFVVAQNDLVPEQWRVLSVSEVDHLQAEITASSYNVNKYAAVENNLVLQAANTSSGIPTVPNPLTNLGVTESQFVAANGTMATRATVYWTGNASTYQVVGKNTSKGTNSVLQTVLSPTADFSPMVKGDSYLFTVTPLNALGQQGLTASLAYTIVGKVTPPSNVTGITYVQEPFAIHLRWSAIPDLDVTGYEVRLGTNWNAGTKLVFSKNLDYQWVIQSAGTYSIWIAAQDSAGNYSATPTLCSVTVTGPAVTSLAYYVSGVNEYLQWAIPSSGFTIDRYEIRYGSTWSGGTYVDAPTTTGYQRRADYSGARTYWVAAIDSAGNYGTPTSVSAYISAAGAVLGLYTTVVDNNVLIYWNPPATGTLPISSYEVRKGSTWSSATLIGSNGNSTFGTTFEQQASTYTYWVAAIDSSGTYGTPTSTTAQVSQPPDYILRANVNSTFSTGGISVAVSKTNALTTPGGLIVPINTTETWTQHFSNNGYATPQAQISAGNTLYAEPTLTTATYSETLDYGSTVPTTSITVTPTVQTITGSVTLSVQIAWSNTSNTGPWTYGTAGSTSAVASNFRYVLVTLSFTATGTTNMFQVQSLNIKLSVKSRNDSGSSSTGTSLTTVGSVSAYWATVTFGYPFISADCPVVTANSTAALLPLIAYTGGTNPTGFQVAFVDRTGANVSSVPFSWTARGY